MNSASCWHPLTWRAESAALNASTAMLPEKEFEDKARFEFVDAVGAPGCRGGQAFKGHVA